MGRESERRLDYSRGGKDMSFSLIIASLFAALALLLYGTALELKAYYYSTIGMLAALWDLAQVATSGNPPSVVLSLGFDGTSFTTYTLAAADWQGLLVFLSLLVVIGATITIDMVFSKRRSRG